MKSLARYICLVAALLLLVGCGSKLTSANLDRVQPQMSKQEVEAILGKPTEVKTTDLAVFSTTTYIYRKGNDEVVLSFLNDKLLTKSGAFGR